VGTARLAAEGYIAARFAINAAAATAFFAALVFPFNN